MRRIVQGTLKRENALLDLAPPTLQNSGIFHDSALPHSHLHFDRLTPKSRRFVDRLCIGLRVRYKYFEKHSQAKFNRIAKHVAGDCFQPNYVGKTSDDLRLISMSLLSDKKLICRWETARRI